MAMVIIAACVVLGLLTITVGARLAGDFIGGVAGAFSNSIGRLVSQGPATAPPSGVTLDTPQIDAAPNGGFTNQPSVPIQGTVPGASVGKTGYSVNVYIVAKGGAQRKVASVPVGGTTRFSTSAITLTEGSNDFVAKLASPTGEGNPSPVVTYILDTKDPSLAIKSPSQGAHVSVAAVDVSGTSDPGVTLTIRNEQSPGGARNSAVIGADGTFKLTIPIVAGANTIDVSAIDQAGNTTLTSLIVNRAYGQLAPHLSVSPTKFRSSSQTTLKMAVHATTFNGAPLASATVTFTVTIHGLGPIVSPELTTDATGTATWQVPIGGSTPGTGQVSVLITTSAGDVVMATTAVTTT